MTGFGLIYIVMRFVIAPAVTGCDSKGSRPFETCALHSSRRRRSYVQRAAANLLEIRLE